MKVKEQVTDQLMTVKELADELGVKTSTIYYWSHIGYIPTVKLGKLLRFRKSSVLKWIDKKEKKAKSKNNLEIGLRL